MTLERNIIVGNGAHQILLPWLADHHVVRTITDARTDSTLDIRSESWTLTGNTIGVDGDALLFSVGMWPRFLRTFRATGNHWFRTAGPDAFGAYVRKHAPVGRLTLLEWQRLIRQDLDSSFETLAPGRVRDD